MQKTSTFGKRGGDSVATTAAVEHQAARYEQQPSELRKLVIFGISATVAMVTGGALLGMMLTASPDTSLPKAAVDDTAIVAPSNATGDSATDKVERQVADAWAICESLNNSGAGTAPCEVGGASITIHTTGSVAHARELCSEAVRAIRTSGGSFESRWTLYIKGPYTGSQSLAYCRLP